VYARGLGKELTRCATANLAKRCDRTDGTVAVYSYHTLQQKVTKEKCSILSETSGPNSPRQSWVPQHPPPPPSSEILRSPSARTNTRGTQPPPLQSPQPRPSSGPTSVVLRAASRLEQPPEQPRPASPPSFQVVFVHLFLQFFD
jgi:hypothetical protein